jgi:hypothetical protein
MGSSRCSTSLSSRRHCPTTPQAPSCTPLCRVSAHDALTGCRLPSTRQPGPCAARPRLECVGANGSPTAPLRPLRAPPHHGVPPPRPPDARTCRGRRALPAPSWAEAAQTLARPDSSGGYTTACEVLSRRTDHGARAGPAYGDPRLPTWRRASPTHPLALPNTARKATPWQWFPLIGRETASKIRTTCRVALGAGRGTARWCFSAELSRHTTPLS